MDLGQRVNVKFEKLEEFRAIVVGLSMPRDYFPRFSATKSEIFPLKSFSYYLSFVLFKNYHRFKDITLARSGQIFYHEANSIGGSRWPEASISNKHTSTSCHKRTTRSSRSTLLAVVVLPFNKFVQSLIFCLHYDRIFDL